MNSSRGFRALPLAAVGAIVAVALAFGCDGKRGGSIAGVARVLHGPSSGTTAFRASVSSVSSSFAVPADGDWLVSPNKVRVNIAHLSFNAANGDGTGTDLTDCNIEFDQAAATLSSLLDCPFTLSRSVTVSDISLQMNPNFEILISDTANGIFTDSLTGGLTATKPAAGGGFIPWAATYGTTAGGGLPAPVFLGSNGVISIAIVMDAVHTVDVVVTGGVPSFKASKGVPIVVFPTFDIPGRATYYSSAATAANFKVPSGYASARVYYAPGPDSQPAFLANTNVCAGTGAVHPTDPALSPVDVNGFRSGGWLGRDPTGTLCWAQAVDQTWSAYASYLTMPEVATLGSSTTISCQATSAPMPPVSGSNYSSGCPAITPSITKSFTLVAH